MSGVATEKRCSKCGKVKSLSEFNKSARHSCGVTPLCKSCNKIEARNRYYSDPDKARARVRKWAAENPEKVKQKLTEWYVKNAEKVKAKRAKWRVENPDAAKARSNKWRAEHPDVARKASKRRTVKITDGYVASTLRLRVDEVPPELIKLKRIQLQITRELRKQK